MQSSGMALMEAYKHVIDRRPFINPNDGFFRVLQDYEREQLGRQRSEEERRA